MLWHQESGPQWTAEFECVRSPSDWSLTRREWALSIGGYLLLAIACYWEAVAIAQVAGRWRREYVSKDSEMARCIPTSIEVGASEDDPADEERERHPAE